MTSHADVVIIGGGLMGTSAAYFLRQRGRSVIVLEKGRVGAQASGVNFGNARLQGRHPEQYALALRAHAIWEEMHAITGVDCEVTANGHLFIALDRGEIGKLEHYAADANKAGVKSEAMGGNEARQRWPYLSPLVQAAAYSARDATANPRLVTPALAARAAALGADIREDVRVMSAERVGEGFRVATAGGETITGGVLLNTAGAWANEVAGWFGESAPMVAAAPPHFVTEPVAPFVGSSVQAIDGSIIFRQTREGAIVAAGYPRGPSDIVANRAPVQPEKVVTAMRRLVSVVPRLGSAHIVRVWSGIEGYIVDMLPVIGPSRTTPGLFHAFGFCGHGFQLGPGVGACLADLASEGRTETPLGAFDIARFAGGVQVSEKFLKEFDAALVAGAGKT